MTEERDSSTIQLWELICFLRLVTGAWVTSRLYCQKNHLSTGDVHRSCTPEASCPTCRQLLWLSSPQQLLTMFIALGGVSCESYHFPIFLCLKSLPGSSKWGPEWLNKEGVSRALAASSVSRLHMCYDWLPPVYAIMTSLPTQAVPSNSKLRQNLPSFGCFYQVLCWVTRPADNG